MTGPALRYGFFMVNHTCPVTMHKLQDPSMVPNHTLRHLINQWVKMGHQFDPRFLKINDHDFPFAASLKHNLKSLEPTFETLSRTTKIHQKRWKSLIPKKIQNRFMPLRDKRKNSRGDQGKIKKRMAPSSWSKIQEQRHESESIWVPCSRVIRVEMEVEM